MERHRPQALTRIALSPLIMIFSVVFSGLFLTAVPVANSEARQSSSFDSFVAEPAFLLQGEATAQPEGLTPRMIKSVYDLPPSGGKGTIAVVNAYDYPAAEDDLNIFSKQNGLPACTTENDCFEKRKMASDLGTDSKWSLQAALDTQWAHAIAPKAKVLLVEAKSDRGQDLLDAVDYARNRPDVVAISMGWGGQEFSKEIAYDFHFTSDNNAVFFAAAGNSRNAVLWPAASSNVVSVGGTTLTFNRGRFTGETAWENGSGGLSKYITQPSYQTHVVPVPKGMRAVPDVSYNADPESGIDVYMSSDDTDQSGWYRVGGTSAGTVQWAAIRALGDSQLNLHQLYTDGMSNPEAYFRDITDGKNGVSGFYSSAGAGYDYITGLGSPRTASF